VLWQDKNASDAPIFVSVPLSSGGQILETPITDLQFTYPLSAVSVYRQKLLFMDSSGRVAVKNGITGKIIRTFPAVGAQDAAFIDDNNVVVGRNAGTGSTPFMEVNIPTGETVPLPVPAAIGSKIFAGESGAIYGGVIDRNANGVYSTAIIKLDLTSPAHSPKILVSPDEDTRFSMAEIGGTLATNLGGDAAVIYQPNDNGSGRVIGIERSPGLPRRVFDDETDFIIVDSEGNLTWHNPNTGAIEALFRLYSGEWELEGRDFRYQGSASVTE
jgi:hypothetical protein